MLRYLRGPLLSGLVFFGGFLAIVLWRAEQPASASPVPTHDRVVISAPILSLLYGGDRFLAANLEAIRLAATGIEDGRVDSHYLIRAHKVVSKLNPCHENNFYFANALLNWGGAVRQGSEILERATQCRFWDELPPFLLGFNQYFFNRNIPEAQRFLHIAADRADANSAGFRKLAIMIQADEFEDENLALRFLREERDKAREAKLVKMLDQRVRRLEGLVVLRDAQRAYEEKTGKPLKTPEALIEAGLLETLPQDPMKLGYEFVDGRFELKEIKVAGVEKK